MRYFLELEEVTVWALLIKLVVVVVLVLDCPIIKAIQDLNGNAHYTWAREP